MKKLNDSFITLRIPSEMRSNLETLAVENECTLSTVVRFAVSNMTVNEEQEFKNTNAERMDRFGGTQKYVQD